MRFFFFFLAVGLALALGGAQDAHAQQAEATLRFDPANGVFNQGATFWVDITVNTDGEQVNAVAAYFDYPADLLEAVAIDKTGSALSLFAEEEIAGGEVRISGGTPTPGFSGVQHIASVQFRVLQSSGTTTLSFTPSSAVLRDSDNKNILELSESGSGIYVFQAPSQQATPTPTPAATPTPSPGQATPSPTPTPEPSFINNVVVEEVTPESARISWTTQEETVSHIEYGKAPNYTMSLVDGESTTDHRVLLSGLDEDSSYVFQITARDASGREHSTTENQFRTSQQTSSGEEQTPTPSPGEEEQNGEQGDQPEEQGGGPLGGIISPIIIGGIIVVLILGIGLFFFIRRQTSGEL